MGVHKDQSLCLLSLLFVCVRSTGCSLCLSAPRAPQTPGPFAQGTHSAVQIENIGRLQLQTLSDWEKSKWTGDSTCANGVLVCGGLPLRTVSGRDRQKQSVRVKLNFPGNTQRSDLQRLWCAGECWVGQPSQFPQHTLPSQKKKRYQTKFKIIKFDYLGQWFPNFSSSRRIPAGLVKTQVAGH